ncbi:formate/nitrite transporter FocA (FNT family) [Christiangramia gaetbulicola]|uniref:Formate/nitrite transporter FocA (FNT family) n=1 Tax=Christiangramia gaetbulicola TaxID=703340 RepID=A0A2T6AH19_9FLAO|nr:formate/nitrite transporter family protein [Christiangramia gaetbulicola]PTX43095.1 formate/nitrite transporter FocA (FNT family) [Christiangramia gaetbulicola]
MDSEKEKKKSEEQKKVNEEIENSGSNDSTKSKTHGEILKQQIIEGCETYDRSSRSILLSSFTAGLEIGFSYLMLCTVYSFFQGTVQEATLFKLMAFVYPIGFILVVLGQSILFTEQTSLLTLPVLSGSRSVMSLFKIWGIVILGNLVGGMLIALTLSWIGPNLGLFTSDTIASIGEHYADYDFGTILVSAILAGWLMGLLSWLATSSKETTAEIIIIYVITAVMGFTGLHHSIIGNIEIFAGMLVSPKIDLAVYLTTLGTALLGNALGGAIFVALLKYRAFIFNVKMP